ncbi:Globin family and Globin-like domain and Globin,structural domain-containing protein [Strongyloides ratti]|uniref:Globin family and Globin-like domain and Globin,structural domain-containing protein n=1 Tax=Strongyloides ratti TaxID=34506 RepID=A0A090L154_STRRB|nr:Globin family and Globin-like domain and Globin,structural domain-containing protein [Strongyloides ratti]CEF61179.1 Globin family and Globin-like domain and Globin,structural domain-containing protein [Strongyloides ratti]
MNCPKETNAFKEYCPKKGSLVLPVNHQPNNCYINLNDNEESTITNSRKKSTPNSFNAHKKLSTPTRHKLSASSFLMPFSQNFHSTNNLHNSENQTCPNKMSANEKESLYASQQLRRCRSASPAQFITKMVCNLSHEQQALIRKSWRRVPKQNIGKIIYQKIYQKCPELKNFLSSDNNCVERHFRYFGDMLQCTVDSLNELDKALYPWLTVIGSGHAGFAITTAHWDAFGEALISSIKQWILSGKEHKETVRAWMKLSCYLIDTLAAASRNGNTTNPRLQLLSIIPPNSGTSQLTFPTISKFENVI